eukprot:1157467-Pelagomonas_calceolata.AAC.13
MLDLCQESIQQAGLQEGDNQKQCGSGEREMESMSVQEHGGQPSRSPSALFLVETLGSLLLEGPLLNVHDLLGSRVSSYLFWKSKAGHMCMAEGVHNLSFVELLFHAYERESDCVVQICQG